MIHITITGQLKQWILQFSNIFAGLQVETGKGADGQKTRITVPINYATQDRAVAWITNRFTSSASFALPMMAVHMSAINLAPTRRKGVGVVDRRAYLPRDGVYPTDGKVLERLMPIPYDLDMTLAIYASNTDQAFQMVEQILMLFDPCINLQKSESAVDWTRISTVELTGVSSEQTVPTGAEKRTIIWSFTFSLPIWLSPPAVGREGVVQKVITRMDTDMMKLGMFDADGMEVDFMFSTDADGK